MAKLTPELTPEACRAARGLLKWGVRELAAEAGLSVETVVMYESGRAARKSTIDAIMGAFTANGVEITNGRGTGARLKMRPQ